VHPFLVNPAWSPDGRQIAIVPAEGATNIWFAPLGRGRPLRLTTGAGPDEAPTIAAGGAIAFVNSRWRNSLEAHDLLTGTTRTLVVHMPFLWGPSVSPARAASRAAFP
jgi:Tol biopolymer transport system component